MNAENKTKFNASLQAAYADLFASDPDYAFSASKVTPAEMADKVFAAVLKGSANITGKGFARACKACDIAQTYKAIDAFLGIERASAKPTAPKPRKVSVIVIPHVQAMMTGVFRIDRAHELVTLTYTDGTREAAKIAPARWDEIHENVFAIVGDVQAQRTT